MGCPYFVIYRSDDRLLVSRTEELPEAFIYQGERYPEVGFYWGDFDHLVDDELTLWGFSLRQTNIYSTQLLETPTWQGCRNVILRDTELYFVFGDRLLDDLEMDGSMIVQVNAYCSPTNQFIIALPECSSFEPAPEPLVDPPSRSFMWTKIGFPIEPSNSEKIPKGESIGR